MITVNLLQDKSRENKYISNTLLSHIESTLGQNKKVILYLNKRGTHSSLICEHCQYLYECQQCDASLNVHKYPQKLICHVCDSQYDIPEKCQQCGQNTLKEVGVGTQQIEDFCNTYFPSRTKIFRFDTDVVKNKKEKEEALKNLITADIIIGTKMITTGFDFKDIGLIGIILLEQELQIPQFNTKEKLFSNIRQLIGRGVRNGNKSEIIIQSYIPENEIIQTLTYKNYKDFFKESLEERKTFYYPPFCEMVTLEYRHNEKQKALDFIQKIKKKLQDNNTKNNIQIILNEFPQRKHNQYHYKLILKGHNLRNFLHCIKNEIFRNKSFVVIFES